MPNRAYQIEEILTMVAAYCGEFHLKDDVKVPITNGAAGAANILDMLRKHNFYTLDSHTWSKVMHEAYKEVLQANALTMLGHNSADLHYALSRLIAWSVLWIIENEKLPDSSIAGRLQARTQTYVDANKEKP